MLKNRYLRISIIVTALLVLGFFIQLDYFVIRPSRAVELGSIVKVEADENKDRGKIFLLTVTQHRANIYTALYGYFHPHMNLNPRERVIPRDMDEDDYRQLLREHMSESKHIAQVVALRRVGYEVDIVSDGVEVIGFLENAPAEGYLQTGDTISSVDGNMVMLATEVSMLVQDREVGEEVALQISRDSQHLEINVPTGPGPEDDNLPYLGIYIRTRPWEPVIPVNITMDTGNIGGPSAGLVFVLEIMNQLTVEDLTGGYMIAGTGSIDLDENVGRIGGVVQKVVAADSAGVDYFLLPEGNYEDAKTVNCNLELVPVSNLEEALKFLETLSSAEDG